MLLPVAVVVLITLLAGPTGEAARFAAPLVREDPDLVMRLWQAPDAVVRDADDRPLTVFGLPAGEARAVLLPVSRWRAAPAGYVPPDLVYSLGRPVRSLLVDDYRAMVADAAADAVDLAIVSGYRSPAEQASAFEAAVWRQLARAGGSIDRAEAEARVARFVAPPGHSQHQLGTAVDVSTSEIGYTIQPRFAETTAGRWLAQRAWAYGFVLPYTQQGESRSGYAFEPWHVRWIGRSLAALLYADGYLEHPSLVVDDYLNALEEILDAEGLP